MNTGEYVAGFYAAGFWGPRTESPESAGHRLQRLVTSLADISPLMREWLLTRSDPSSTAVPIPRSVDALADMVKTEMERLREGMAPETAKGLGAVMRFWTGTDSTTAGLTIRLGNTDPRLGNAVVLNLPQPWNEQFSDLKNSRLVLDAIISAWDPDTAVYRPASIPRRDSLALMPDKRVELDEQMRRFPDWLVYKRGSPIALGGPYAGRTSESDSG